MATASKRSLLKRNQKDTSKVQREPPVGGPVNISPLYVEVLTPSTSSTQDNSIFKGPNETIEVKEFGVILITKNTDLISNVCTFKTCTFNPTVIKDWSRKSLIPKYLATLFNGADGENKVIDKVNSVHISTELNLASAGGEAGVASLNWTDTNADVSINAIGHIW